MPEVLTQFTHKLVVTEGPFTKSVTVPDQAYTIAQLLERHRQGILTDTSVMRDGQYFDGDLDSDDGEKLANADIFDRTETFKRNQQAIEEIRAKKAADAKAAKEKEDLEFQEFKKSKASFFSEKEAPPPAAGGSSATKPDAGAETRPREAK